jgi:ABC-type antimicrobial peptide transport system permease subunit
LIGDLNTVTSAFRRNKRQLVSMVLAAWIFFDGNQVSSAARSFQPVISSRLALPGVAWALVMGFIGGLLPALRTARASVTVGPGAV